MSIELTMDDISLILARRGLETKGKVQKFIDSEVLRRSAKRVPKRTGMLEDSGMLGTKIGSGVVRYTAPYAKPQYYSKRKVGSATGSQRGPQWWERTKNAEGQDIINAAAKMAGGHT